MSFLYSKDVAGWSVISEGIPKTAAAPCTQVQSALSEVRGAVQTVSTLGSTESNHIDIMSVSSLLTMLSSAGYLPGPSSSSLHATLKVTEHGHLSGGRLGFPPQFLSLLATETRQIRDPGIAGLV